MNKLPEASSTKAGIVTTSTQSLAGDKTIVGNLTVDPGQLFVKGGTDSYVSLWESTVERWRLQATGSTNGFDFIYQAGGITPGSISGSGSWTLGPSGFTGSHTIRCGTLSINSAGGGVEYTWARNGTLKAGLVVNDVNGTDSLAFYNASIAYTGFVTQAGAWNIGVSNTTQTLNGGVRVGGSYYQSNSPGSNWTSASAVPTNSIVMFGAGGPFNVCGMAYPANAGSNPLGMILIIINRSGGTISVLNESGTETNANNRFRTKGGSTLSIPAGEAKQFIWSETSLAAGGSALRWIEL